VVGYVVMPEHVHFLISESGRGNPSTVMQVLKQRLARQVLREWRKHGSNVQGGLWEPLSQGHVWQRRFYDFNVFSRHKRLEKLRYMHENPVKEELAQEPEQWVWSSYRSYALGEPARERSTAGRLRS
jgi:REP-associated tyrosine transposase